MISSFRHSRLSVFTCPVLERIKWQSIGAKPTNSTQAINTNLQCHKGSTVKYLKYQHVPAEMSKRCLLKCHVQYPTRGTLHSQSTLQIGVVPNVVAWVCIGCICWKHYYGPRWHYFGTTFFASTLKTGEFCGPSRSKPHKQQPLLHWPETSLSTTVCIPQGFFKGSDILKFG